MTDTAGDQPPFPGFPGFPPAEMLDKMWGMMRLTPFGAAFPGMQPGSAQGFGEPLAAMSNLMKPLMDVEELDKRITDMRAVEQWLKLNLNMLQSAIQGLEVQRATLSTLSAFGAFAQAAMTQPAEAAKAATSTNPADTQARSSSPWSTSSASTTSTSGSSSSAGETSADPGSAGAPEEGSGAQSSTPPAGAAGVAGFDPSGWWNLLQSQFNQLAAFAMQPNAQPNAAGSEGSAQAGEKAAAPKQADAADKRDAKAAEEPEPAGSAGSAGSPGAPGSNAKPAAKRASTRRNGEKPASGSAGGAARGEK